MNWIVIFAGDASDPDSPVQHDLHDAREVYGWEHVVEAESGLDAIRFANDKDGSLMAPGEVYHVAPLNYSEVMV